MKKTKRMIKTKIAPGKGGGGGSEGAVDNYDLSLTSPYRTHVQYNT